MAVRRVEMGRKSMNKKENDDEESRKVMKTKEKRK